MSGTRRVLELALSIGAYPEESETQRAKRRIMIGAFWLATILTLVLTIPGDIAADQFWLTATDSGIIVVSIAVAVLLHLRPRWFAVLINLVFAAIFVVQLVQTALFGGLLPSGLVVLYNLLFVVLALIVFGRRTAEWWFAAFVVSVIYAVAVPDWIDPVYPPRPVSASAVAVVATGIVVFVIMLYFVRQRDRFQQESDDLLHNILPDEIVGRLKASDATIADSFDAASVLFADVAGFTPMSAGMSPAELVALLDEVFTTFDAFVADLDLEKIKTVGDAYMVAAGVPRPRLDHAEAIAELALRFQDHVAANPFDGHRIALRIGINSGPVVAGVIGTHKFAYDLWGDVVNTASRMESEGIPGQIQVSPATYDLIRDRFVCEPRGPITVKGKGEMETYILLARLTPPGDGAGTGSDRGSTARP